MKHFFACVFVLMTAAVAHAQDSVKPLLIKLASKESETRFDALMALADLGPIAAPATDRLIAILKDFDEQERTLATIVLGKIGNPAILPLVNLLDQEDEAVRHNAVWSLALMGADAKATVPRLSKLFANDPDTDVRSKAVFALARIAPTDADVFAVMAKQAIDEKTPLQLRLAILDESRHCGEPALTVLGRALQNVSTYEIAQQSLKHVLEKHKTKSATEAMRPFVEIAYDQALAHPTPPWARQPNSPVISELCDSAGMSYVIATLGDQILAPVEKRLQSKDAVERAAACAMLGKMAHTLRANGDAPHLVERIGKSLLPIFQDPHPAPRRAVIENIPRTKASVAALRTALMDEDLQVRRAAYFSSGRFDLTGLRARFAKATGEEQVRIACVLASLEFDKESLGFLWKYLEQPKAEFRHRAAYTLGSLQALTLQQPAELKKLAVPVLMESLKGNEPIQRAQAAEALATAMWQLDEKSVPTLIAALKDKDTQVRQNVVAALRTAARPERKDILPAVLPFLRDPDPQTRIYAIHCFGNTGKAGVADLVKLLETEKNRVVRNQIMTSLQQPDEPAAIEALFKTADNAEDWNHAIDALWRVGEVKTFPRTLEILRKQDRAIDETFKEVKVPPAKIVDAVLSLTPLFEREDIAVNRGALRSLDALTKILWDDTKIWMMPLQRAYEKRLQGLQPSLAAKEEARRLEAVLFLGELRALQRSMYFHISSRTDPKLRPEMDELWHKNAQSIDDFLSVARRDEQLAIRRAARKAMLTLTPLDQSR